jgi:hypothetical protein
VDDILTTAEIYQKLIGEYQAAKASLP